MKVLVALLAAVAALAGAPSALADACGLPDSGPLWVDFAGHDAPIPVKPGMVLAVASGTDTPQQMRSQGAATVLFDLNFNKRVGTTSTFGTADVADAPFFVDGAKFSSIVNFTNPNAPPAVASGAVVAVFVLLVPSLPREGSSAPGGAGGGGEPPWMRSCASAR